MGECSISKTSEISLVFGHACFLCKRYTAFLWLIWWHKFSTHGYLTMKMSLTVAITIKIDVHTFCLNPFLNIQILVECQSNVSVKESFWQYKQINIQFIIFSALQLCVQMLIISRLWACCLISWLSSDVLWSLNLKRVCWSWI